MTSHASRDRAPIDDLLTTGTFRTSRSSRATSPLPSRSQNHQRRSLDHDIHESSTFALPASRHLTATSTIKSTTSQAQPQRRLNPLRQAPRTPSTTSTHRQRRNWPPAPKVEEENAALSQEIRSRSGRYSHSRDDDVPARGVVEQIPVIIEASLSPREAEAVRAETLKGITNQKEKNEERRFVLKSQPQVPMGENVHEKNSHRSRSHGRRNHERSSHDNRSHERRTPQSRSTSGHRAAATSRHGSTSELHQRKDESKKGFHEQNLHNPRQERPPSTLNLPIRHLSPPPLGRRRSRQDASPTRTYTMPEPPIFRRTASTYTYLPEEKISQSRLSSVEHNTRSRTNQTSKIDGQDRRERRDTAPPRTPTVHPLVAERRRETPSSSPRTSPTTSRPTTPIPINESKSKRYSMEAFPPVLAAHGSLRNPQLGWDNGPEYASHRNDKVQKYEPRRETKTRAPSAHSDARYYLSSGDDLGDSTDSEPRRRQREQHRHRPHRDSNALQPVDHRERGPSRRSSRSQDDRRSSNPDMLPIRPVVHNMSTQSSPRPSPRLIPRPSPHSSPHPSPRSSPRTSPKVSPTHSPAPIRRDTRDSRLPGMRAPSPGSAYNRKHSDVKVASIPTGYNANGCNLPSVPPLKGLSLPIRIPPSVGVEQPATWQRNSSTSDRDDEVDPFCTSRTTSTLLPKTSVYTPSSAGASWQPPPFSPSTADGPCSRSVGSYRRYSEDVSSGNIAPLPVCPPAQPIRGFGDWMTLPSASGLHVCPSCYNSTMAKTSYAQHFIAAPSTLRNTAIACDFGSQPWYRIAWLLSVKARPRRLDMLYAIASISMDEKPCLGKHKAVRKWYSVIDPSTGTPVDGFDVCVACMRSVEAVLPVLKGLFVRTDSEARPSTQTPRVCDLRFDSRRFVAYFDALELMATDSRAARYGLDMDEFVALARLYSTLPECPGEDKIVGGDWWCVPQLPELSLCPDCFERFVRPHVLRRKPVALMFRFRKDQGGSIERSAEYGAGAVRACGLWRPALREAVLTAIEADDLQALKNAVRHDTCSRDMA